VGAAVGREIERERERERNANPRQARLRKSSGLLKTIQPDLEHPFPILTPPSEHCSMADPLLG
jgi:hypothetical protein